MISIIRIVHYTLYPTITDENEHKCKLEDFIGKTCEETKDILSYIDRDWEE